MNRLLALATLALAALAPATAAAQQKVFLAPTSATDVISCGGTRTTPATANANVASSKILTAGLLTQVQAASIGPGSTAAVDAANTWGANAFVTITSNSGGGHGAETYHCTGCTNGTNLANAINAAEATYDPATRGVKINDTWDVLKRTTMGAAVTFVVFDDCATAHAKTSNLNECAYLTSAAGQQTIGTAIASGTCTFLGTTCPQVCTAGASCNTGKKGICAAGTVSCPSGVFTCTQNVQAGTETCNGADDDCDGSTDEAPTGGWGTCSTGKLGVCAPGTNTCTSGSLSCVQNVQSSTETCNKLDDDCDGSTDEAPTGGWGACSTGKPGPCGTGTRTCTNGVAGCQQNVQPVTETCNNVDDDCDGVLDNAPAAGWGTCSTGKPGPCAAGTNVCSAGKISCQQNVPPGTETCNNVDDDCDGTKDNTPPGGWGTCVTGKPGACASGTRTCSNGTTGCTQTVQPVAETCNGIDDDCDGTADNAPAGGWGSCSTGKSGPCAAGTKTCTSGVPGCAQTVQPATETCNKVDDDCDGTVDDAPPSGWGTCNTGKSGPCAAGHKTCANGAESCAQDVQPADETCNGFDDDCDGQTDEGDPGSGTACNTGLPGACAAGKNHCRGGTLQCDALAQSTAETCNGLDEDCDGQTDEEIADREACTIAGQVGVCGAGVMRCSGGTFKCQQRVPTGDEVCDGLDNDCDGTTDEGIPCDELPDAGEVEPAGPDAQGVGPKPDSGSVAPAAPGACGCSASGSGLALMAMPLLLAGLVRRRPRS
ncbi:MAG: N-acetylmuramoyl-L-alanine amidase [Myxococcales bacterium]